MDACSIIIQAIREYGFGASKISSADAVVLSMDITAALQEAGVIPDQDPDETARFEAEKSTRTTRQREGDGR